MDLLRQAFQRLFDLLLLRSREYPGDVIAVVLAVLVIGLLIASRTLTDGILGLTALAIIWYTWETQAIRRHQGDEARRRSVPILGFDVRFPSTENPSLSVRFVVVNRSDRMAVIRPTIRVQDPEGIRHALSGLYGGEVDWEVWAFESWDGHFELNTEQQIILPDKEVRLSEAPSPIETIALDVQVAVYNARGEFQYLYRHEYHVEVKSRKAFHGSWPEVAPRTFPEPAHFPLRLDVDAGAGTRRLL